MHMADMDDSLGNLHRTVSEHRASHMRASKNNREQTGRRGGGERKSVKGQRAPVRHPLPFGTLFHRASKFVSLTGL